MKLIYRLWKLARFLVLFINIYIFICNLILSAGGASNSACSETYAGNAPFSEIETKTLSKYIGSLSDKLYAYVAFHSYSQLLLIPYGHTTAHLDNYDDLVSIVILIIESSNVNYNSIIQ